MTPYRFRLSALQQLRESRRDDARQRLADAHLAADRLAEEATRVEAQIADARAARAAEAAAPRPDVNRLLAGQQHQTVLAAQLHDLTQKRRLVEQEIERRRGQLAAADQQVRVLERLDERGRERHRVAETAAEQKQLDEVAALAWARAATPTNHA